MFRGLKLRLLRNWQMGLENKKENFAHNMIEKK